MNTKTTEQYILIANKLEISFAHVMLFRRKSMALRRWYERECGDSDNYKSWCIERDPKTDKPLLCVYPYTGIPRFSPIADREKGARKAIAKLCEQLNLFHFVQTDCRGLALYLSREELTDTNYNQKGFGVGF